MARNDTLTPEQLREKFLAERDRHEARHGANRTQPATPDLGDEPVKLTPTQDSATVETTGDAADTHSEL